MLLSIDKTSLEDRFDEFDLWITPKLAEIKDTDKYTDELDSIISWLNILGGRTNKFEKLSDLTTESFTDSILDRISSLSDPNDIEREISSAASLMFLVTGKSDNNCKCQFPIFLRDVMRIDKIPSVKMKKGIRTIAMTSIPREIKSTKVAKLVSDLKDFKKEQRTFLLEYVSFILDEKSYLQSFWSIGNSYESMKKMKLEREFLMPLVVFKVRGSVSASGGHDPENVLRELMQEWGLEAGIDFNTTDVVIGKETDGKKVKTRAYDFILPYNVDEWLQNIFIQCQFYAGDSGSVSHKNVDQTRASRDFTKTKFEAPIFLEFVDGAGYFSSLNGDLKSILSMSDTEDFFQLRTAPFKLRRQLKNIGFLTPLELVHALFLTNMSIHEAIFYLTEDGYDEREILRVIEKSTNSNILQINKNQIASVCDKFYNTARTYFLYDSIILNSSPFELTNINGGVILVPGSKVYQGIKLSEINRLVIEKSGVLKEYFSQSANFLNELEILADKKYIINA